MDKILIIGATGLLGRPVADRLIHDGYDVRVLARDASRARELLGSEVEVIAGDATDPTSLERALAGRDGVHLSVSGGAELPAARGVAELAPRLGVQRITYLSGSTVDETNSWYPLVAHKLAAERAIADAGVAYTVFCPTWPMEQLPRFVMGDTALVIGDRLPHLHWFAAADLARMVSRAFTTPASADRRLYIHGPEALTMPAAVAAYCRALHPRIAEVTVLPVGVAKARAEASGDEVMAFMAETMAYFDGAGELGDPGEADRLLGAPETTLDDWIAQAAGGSV